MKTLENLRVVLDTNVILNALSKKLPYQHVLRLLLSGHYTLCLTHDILLEYEEKVTEFYSQLTASNFLEALTASTHVHKLEVFFQFNLITADPDDNKFVDCAVAANTHYLVSDDRDFRILKEIDFPKIEYATLDEFCQILEELI